MLLLSSFGESLFQLIIVLVIFVGVLAATYFVTRFLAGYQKAQQFNKNLEIVETIKLTTNKYVQILRAGDDKFFVIAIGKDEVTLLGEISSSELREIDSEESNLNASLPQIDFKTLLDKFTKKN